ncbi:MAG TPA: PEP/pyruvate-binding domain-containing protein [Acidobacteriota bacterium]
MKTEAEPERELSLGSRFRGFQDLMRYRVQDILLVSNLYDSFILSEDGHLSELILDEVLNLNLRHTPGLTHVTSGAEALKLAREQKRHNLIISSIHIGDMDPLELARAVKQESLGIPVVLLAYDNRELTDFVGRNPVSDFDRIFLWQGDARILLAITKYVEDRLNVAHDTGIVGVQAILVIEDNIRFYSSFLPMIYSEVMNHAHQLMPEGINLSHKLMRLRARPKILLCGSFEEAWDYFDRYQANILGVISDIEFPKRGEVDRQAGLEFAQKVRERQPDVPILLQSSRPENQRLAHAAGATFLLKGSPVLLQQLRQFMLDNFGFGDFVFRRADGSEVDRAHDLKSLEEKLYSVPPECLAYHGERNHFSNWLKARTEFALAHKLRPRKVADFGTLEHLRRDLIRSIHQYRRERQRGSVADFNSRSFDASNLTLARLGGGSIGGKARGLAFANMLLGTYHVGERFPEVEISVPPSVVVGTDVFDRFLEQNELSDFAINETDDREILARFLTAPFPEDAAWDLAAFVEQVKHPLAVRSSSLLEDSQYQPLAGVYETYMLPNNHPDPRMRRQQLINAIKRIYASTFSSSAKAFLRSTPYRLEEEKMAVILQKMVGAVHQDRFYPEFAGVARSFNFYPTPPMNGSDGIVAVALGLGETVAKGGVCVRFCPKYPRHLVQFSSVQDVLQNSQREFYALVLSEADGADPSERLQLSRFDLSTAEADGTIGPVGSTYSPENDAVYDGLARAGVPVVSFAPVLKQRLFPLAEILDLLLEIGEQGTSAAVEIEFAVNLSTPSGFPQEFGFLQMRPLSRAPEVSDLDWGQLDRSQLICSSSSVLGNGALEELRDLLVVDFHRFERSRSLQVAGEVARFNAELSAAGTPYILIGVGRWGSIDPLLGIPVTWDQISGARVIVESGFRDFVVTPSQGTHFFQNLTSCNVGYFTVNPESGQGFVDWDWLAAQPARQEREFVRLLHFDAPLAVRMNGKANQGVILKP